MHLIMNMTDICMNVFDPFLDRKNDFSAQAVIVHILIRVFLPLLILFLTIRDLEWAILTVVSIE